MSNVSPCSAHPPQNAVVRQGGAVLPLHRRAALIPDACRMRLTSKTSRGCGIVDIRNKRCQSPACNKCISPALRHLCLRRLCYRPSFNNTTAFLPLICIYRVLLHSERRSATTHFLASPTLGSSAMILLNQALMYVLMCTFAYGCFGGSVSQGLTT